MRDKVIMRNVCGRPTVGPDFWRAAAAVSRLILRGRMVLDARAWGGEAFSGRKEGRDFSRPWGTFDGAGNVGDEKFSTPARDADRFSKSWRHATRNENDRSFRTFDPFFTHE